jgi:hypothetical protein
MKTSYLLVSSALLAAAVLAPASAMALDVTRPRDAFIISATKPGDVSVGQWHCFQESTQLVEVDYQEYCRYVCKWVNDCDEPLSTNLYVDELVTPGYADCDENSYLAIHTHIKLAPYFVSKGFDRHNSKRVIKALIQGEDGEQDGVNETNGSIAFASGGYPEYFGFETELTP